MSEAQLPDDNDVMLTVSQVAHRLSVPVSWVYSSSESGALPSYKVGRYRRFSSRDIEAYLAKCRQVNHEQRPKARPSYGRVDGRDRGMSGSWT